MPRTKQPAPGPLDEVDLLSPETPKPTLYNQGLYQAKQVLAVAKDMKEFADTSYLPSEVRHRLSNVYTKLCHVACDAIEEYLK